MAKSKKAKVATPKLYKEPKRVNITRASNGYTISCYSDRGEVLEVAKNYPAAQKIAAKLLKS